MNNVSTHGTPNYCTPDHCIYPYDPEPVFEILETDSEGTKEAKRLWNASEHSCHPNYMNGIEMYRILNTYKKEHAILTKIWEEKAKHEPGLFSTYYDEIKQAELEGREIIEMLTRKKSIVSQFCDDHPTASRILNVTGVASFALFFFVSLGAELFLLGAAMMICAMGGTFFYINNEIKPIEWIQNQHNNFVQNRIMND